MTDKHPMGDAITDAQARIAELEARHARMSQRITAIAKTLEGSACAWAPHALRAALSPTSDGERG